MTDTPQGPNTEPTGEGLDDQFLGGGDTGRPGGNPVSEEEAAEQVVDTIEEPRKGVIEQIDLQTEVQNSYLEYAMSVIVGRALPDVRDGLKPVHRRVIYAMYDGGYRPDRGWNKCSRVVGEVMGLYHPHGDSAIYDTLVRLAQPWVMRPRWSAARATSVRPATTRPRRCGTPSARWRRWPWRWSATSTRTPSISRTTTTAARRSRRCCRPGSRTCWSTARPGSRSDGHQHPHPQPARGQ